MDRSALANVPTPYVPPTSFDLKSVTKAAQNVFGTVNPTVARCLHVWERDADGQTLSTDEGKVLGAVRKAVERTYKSAALSLTQAFGRYCAYCERPLSEYLQVEHVMPKSQYPTLAVDPDNLLLACAPCNRRKSDAPLRIDAAKWLTTTTPATYYAAIRATHYCWPDLDPSPTWLPLRFEYRDPVRKAWIEVDPATSVDAGLTCRTDPHVVPVRADVPGTGADLEVRVRVADASPSGANPTRGDEMIRLCGLNAAGSESTDAWVGKRTRTWLEAVGQWHAVVADPAGQQTAIGRGLLDLARHAGCFTVWHTTARLIDPALATLFVQEMGARFPGTDVLRLP